MRSVFLSGFFLCWILTAIGQAPVADFSASNVAGCAPLVVSFTDKSTNTPTSWTWDLGNGTVSTLQNPGATFTSPGNYTVKLTSSNGNGASSVTKTAYINVYAQPTANFSASDTTGCTPVSATFSDLSASGSGTVNKWEWNFGDGTTSALQNPSHTYTNPGKFGVFLKVTNSNGCSNVFSRSQYIKADASVSAGFNFSTPSYCALPVEINFNNTSVSGGAVSYSWRFGDGFTSSANNPAHIYNTYGNYTINLLATTDKGCTDSIKKTISLPSKSATFQGPSSLCTGLTGFFNIATTGQVGSIFWDMGDSTFYNTESVNHAYAASGNFTITVITDFGTCRDTIKRTVAVNKDLTADFSSNVTVRCKAPFTVNFTNTSLGATSWLWDFGDGTQSAVKDPTHTFIDTGSFTITLTAQNSSGCQTVVTKQGFINIGKPIFDFSKVVNKGCLPFTFSPLYSVSRVDSITSYLWNFGDGATSTQAFPSHNYNSAGSYPVSLAIVTKDGCTDTLTVPQGVKTGIPAPVDFSVNKNIVCGKGVVEFTATAGPAVTVFEWRFGDSTISAQKNPTHNYTDTGFFSVSLSIENNGCLSTVKKDNIVKVQPPVAAFKFDKDCLNKQKVSFTNTSSGAISNLWDFGDNTSSTAISPGHDYSATGKYQVRLITTNGSCSDTMVKTVPVWLEAPTFTFSKDTLCTGERSVIRMVHANDSAITAYYWNAEMPSYPDYIYTPSPIIGWDYLNAGDFGLKVYTIDSFGCTDTIVQPVGVKVFGPKANFGVDVASGCLNVPAIFTDSSNVDPLDKIVNYQWNFGDGSGQQNAGSSINHTYATGGNYSVKLVITDRLGCSDSLTRFNFISRSEGIADFTSADTLACINSPVHFSNTSGGIVTGSFWSFGDGSTSTDRQPVHQYTDSGSYTVRLKITGANVCRDTIEKTQFITVKQPKAAFSVSDTFVSCPPVQIKFFDSSYYGLQYEWNFDDGNLSTQARADNYYFYPGTYHPKLKITSGGGCTDSASTTIVISGPEGQLDYTGAAGCAPLTVNFSAKTKGSIQFTWDYGNGVNTTGTDSVTTYTYTRGGRFLPTVIIKNPAGCSVSLLGKDTVVVDEFSAGFSADKLVLCDSGYVQFTDSLGNANSLLVSNWDFGDGTTSASKNPRHYYSRPGKYNVRLSISAPSGCNKQVVKNQFIDVAATPIVNVSSSADSCTSNIIKFAARSNSDTAIRSWQWQFGNGQQFAGQYPPLQTFTSAGNFQNQLIVTSNAGCRVNVSQPVNINSIFELIRSADTAICRGASIQLSVTGLSSYNWQADNSLSCTTCNTPVASPLTDSWYKISGPLIPTGCIVTDSIFVKVIQPYKLTATNNIVLCNAQALQLQAAGAPAYRWLPATAFDNPAIANPVAQVDKSVTFNVIGYDSLGCFTDTVAINVVVSGRPKVELGPDVTISVGNTYQFSPVVTADVVNYRWTPAGGLSCTTCERPLLNVSGNQQYAVVVANNYGCEASDSINIFVTCDNSTLFIPNTFSPNGDGVNDYFYPRGKGVRSIDYLAVFNRWGQKVFEKRNVAVNNADTGWNGKVNGKVTESGVYTYVMKVICDNSQVLNYSGNINLIQ